jgi:hypothetical protein
MQGFIDLFGTGSCTLAKGNFASKTAFWRKKLHTIKMHYIKCDLYMAIST